MAKLHTEYAKSAIRGQSEIDNDIRNYINKSDNYDEILKTDNRWEVFYHLSSMRLSLFNWYEFDSGAELLEIGAGLGALTGLFCNACNKVTVVEKSLARASTICERYADKDNLDIYAGDIRKMNFERKFDYIIAVGILGMIAEGAADNEYYAEFLGSLKNFLKKEGKLLIAVENRFGIRYFCGYEDPYTGFPFSGINNYPRGTKGRGFSRKEIENIIKLGGFSKHKFYYPYPDYQLPQLIYTDSYLLGENISERLMPYYLHNDTLLAYENDLYADLSENGVLPFFANSYLVECIMEGATSNVIYAALTTDRGEQHGFATTILENGTVKKKALYPKGRLELERFYHHILDIQKHCVNVVPHNMENGCIIMPRIECMPFSDQLKDIILKGKEKIFSVFDQLYECILNSSEHIPTEENSLMTPETLELPWGIILNKAYIDMVPFNCFYLNGQFLFFDQEFVRDKFPAKYTLFRAIFYTYLSIPKTEGILPVEECKERYELKELWQIFVETESAFVENNRNTKLYEHFYKWTYVNKGDIYNRAHILKQYGSLAAQPDTQFEKHEDTSSEEEYTITDKLLEIQKIGREILSVFQNVCEQYKLQYFVFYGTLLGAVRHRGFIPWDDDIDVVMPRKDYNKLLEIAEEAFQYPYALEVPGVSGNSFYGGYIKLRNSDTTGIEFQNWGHSCNHGMWIDIFPLDVFDEDNKRREQQLRKLRIIQRLLFAKIYNGMGKDFKDVPAWRWRNYCILSKIMSKKQLFTMLDKVLIASNGMESQYVAVLARYTKPNGYRFFNKNIFSSQKQFDFEDMEVNVPDDYETCLEITMGKDYMKYPPIVMRHPHHMAFFDTKTPYKKYCRRFFDIFTDTVQREIIIFGAGIMFEDYMCKYGKKYSPSFIIDNDKNKWGTTKSGIMIKNPDELLKVDEKKRHIIICNIYYKEIEKQLAEMGIDNYYIYVQQKKWLLN